MDVKDSILYAGVNLLKEHGISALTQPKVAKTAGVKQSHLTYYFPRRSDLLLAVAERAIGDILASLQKNLANHPPQTAFTGPLAQAMIEGVPPRIMLGLIVAADSDPTIRPALRQLIENVRRQIGILLEKAGLPADSEAALFCHATIVGLAVLHDAQRTPRSAEEVETGINALFERLNKPNPEASVKDES